MTVPRRRHAIKRVAATVGVLLATTTCASTTTTPPAGQTTRGPATTPATSGTAGPSTTAGGAKGPAIVFNGQGNNLDAYETTPPFKAQRVIKTIADDPAGVDINAQICFFPDGSDRFIAGEDTGQKEGDLQGWGIFHLAGTKVGELSAHQLGKLVPTYQNASDNAENYGCGFLKDGRVLTTDIGNQALGPADGQLIVWFPPFDSEKVKYCKIDTEIATAQSIYVDGDDNVYVASARPAAEGQAGSGVWRYKGPFPTSNDAKGGCGRTDSTGAPLADSFTRELFIRIDEKTGMFSPTGIAAAPRGGFYVSSVFTGVINEYDANGTFVRTVLKPPEGEKLGDTTSFSTGTPLGIGVGPDGTLYYADIGVVLGKGNPGPGAPGSVRRITFVDGAPQPPETMAKGLAFPDGIGVLVPRKP